MTLATSHEFVLVPVDGPSSVDLTQYSCAMAIIPDDGTEPADLDYLPATWLNGEISLLPNAGSLPAGQYMVFVRISAFPEDVRLTAGRLRVGDVRT